jgi:hypothetical protein
LESILCGSAIFTTGRGPHLLLKWWPSRRDGSPIQRQTNDHELIRFTTYISMNQPPSLRCLLPDTTLYCTTGLHLKIYISFKKYCMTSLKNWSVAGEVVSCWKSWPLFILSTKRTGYSHLCALFCLTRVNMPPIGRAADASRRLDRPTACATSAHIARPSSFSHRRCPLNG